MHTTTLLVALFALGLEACVIDSVPTPEHNPRPSNFGDGVPTNNQGYPSGPSGARIIEGYLYVSTDGGGPSVLVVGAPFAVTPSGYVGLENPTNHAYAQRPVASDGSFWLSIGARVGDVLRLVYFHSAAEVLAEVQVPVAPASNAALADSLEVGKGATATAPTVMVTSPDAQGLVTVTGASGVVSPGTVMVLASSAGAARVLAVAGDGSFSLSIPAQTGDTVTLFAVAPGLNHSGGPLTTLTVP